MDSARSQAGRSDAENLTLSADWDAACRRMVEQIKLEMERFPTFAERSVGVGQGAGGDYTLEIDEVCEDVVFAELEALSQSGADFCAIA